MRLSSTIDNDFEGPSRSFERIQYFSAFARECHQNVKWTAASTLHDGGEICFPLSLSRSRMSILFLHL